MSQFYFLQALIWCAIACCLEIGRKSFHSTYKFIENEWKLYGNIYIRISFIYLCVCMCSLTGAHIYTFQTTIVFGFVSFRVRFLKSKTFIEWKTLIQTLHCIVLASINHLLETTILNHIIPYSFPFSLSLSHSPSLSRCVC